jgi:hypothetical protein
MTLRHMLTDTVSLVKQDGRRIDNIKAHVQPEKVFIDDTSLPFQEGDRILRELPSGQVEEYRIIDTGYQSGMGGIEPHYQMKVQKLTSLGGGKVSTPLTKHEVDYVDQGRLRELRAIQSSQFDLAKLVALCEELNRCYHNDCFFAVAMLTRAILDHVPPIFRYKSFPEVANNYKGTKSFVQSMQHLENSSRKIADSYLHTQIRSKESLPTRVQVNFANDLDVLLSEIVRTLK